MSSSISIDRPGVGIGLPLILALVFANLLGGPLRIARPPVPRAETVPVDELEAVPARLWRDPLEAGYAHVRALAARSTEDLPPELRARAVVQPGELRRELRRHLGSARAVTLIPVLLPGGDRSEPHEDRLRTRYAVVAALTREAGREDRAAVDRPPTLKAVDPEHIGLARFRLQACDTSPGMTMPPPIGAAVAASFARIEKTLRPDEASHRPASGESIEGAGLLVPFEWFESKERAALVLWIDQLAIQRDPLFCLADLVHDLRSALEPGDATAIEVAAIGPNDSGMLLRMLEDDRAWKQRCWSGPDHEHALAGARLISPRSTLTSIPGSRRGLDAPQPPLFDERGSGLVFERTIGTDRELATLLMAELRARRPDVFPDSDLDGFFRYLRDGLGLVRFYHARRGPLRVALVSELDTDYARAWATLLEEAGTGTVELVSSVRYLRGIDGRMPGREASALHEGEEEPATGEGQQDYLRRLDRKLDGDHYDAIGVLGTDVYDKVALLQVLRPRFPDALFFTTDVDARLLPRLSSVHTLNLLVASYYGLILKGELDLPPMRSAYQIATFLAACRALEPPLAPGAPWRHDPRAHVFEVGRTWIHQLEPSSPVEAAPRARGEDPNPPPEDLPRPWLFRGGHGTGVVVVALLAALVVGCARPWGWPGPVEVARRASRALARRTELRSVRRPIDVDGRPFLSLVLVFVLGACAVGIALLYDFMRDQTRASEPFFVVEGISVWPTIWIRMLATLVAVFGYFRIWSGVHSMQDGLSQYLPAPLRHPDDPIQCAWRRFSQGVRWRSVTLWSLVASGVYYWLTGKLFRYLGRDMPPVRGERAFLIERFVLWLSVVAFVLLVFVVLRITVVATRFIRDLARTGTDDWPVRLREYACDHGLDAATGTNLLRVRIVQVVGSRIGSCVWWPAGVLFLMVVSRSNVFDRWSWPPALVLTLSVSFLALLLAGHGVRRAASGLRTRSVEALRRLRLEHIDDAGQRARIETVIDELRALRSGVFAPLWEHPLLRAWLLPLAALGANTSLEHWLPRLMSGL